MAIKEEEAWAKLLGAIIAFIFLMCVWIMCGGWLLDAINKGDGPPRTVKDERR